MAARGARLAASALAAVWAGPAAAQVDLFSPETLHGVIDLRAAAADGEPSFTTNGFGKFRYGGQFDGLDPKLQLALAAVEWTPRFDWEWSAVVDAGHQPGQENWFDLYQAYLLFKPVPRSATRFKVRLGYFYPPVSLEHDARVWGLTDTITPSAINSWVGEEVKVIGAEGFVSRDFEDQSVGLTGAVFGYDDTAGTLLAYRGWGLDDLQSQAFGGFQLPPPPPAVAPVQQNETYSSREIDGRLGYYVKLAWATPAPVSVEAFWFDNDGDRTSVTLDQQWAWSTHFLDLGATVRIDDKTRLLAQAVDGAAAIDPYPGARVDIGFRSAYALLSRDLGQDTVTARADLFETHDASEPPLGLGEHGWALTAAWRRPLSKLVDLRLEVVQVESDRPSRVLAGEDPFQAQTLLQSSLRLSF